MQVQAPARSISSPAQRGDSVLQFVGRSSRVRGRSACLRGLRHPRNTVECRCAVASIGPGAQFPGWDQAEIWLAQARLDTRHPWRGAYLSLYQAFATRSPTTRHRAAGTPCGYPASRSSLRRRDSGAIAVALPATRTRAGSAEATPRPDSVSPFTIVVKCCTMPFIASACAVSCVEAEALSWALAAARCVNCSIWVTAFATCSMPRDWRRNPGANRGFAFCPT